MTDTWGCAIPNKQCGGIGHWPHSPRPGPNGDAELPVPRGPTPTRCAFNPRLARPAVAGLGRGPGSGVAEDRMLAALIGAVSGPDRERDLLGDGDWLDGAFGPPRVGSN